MHMQGIQLTATTPTSNAVRLETGMIELELSNRVQGVAAAGQSASSAQASAQKNTPLKVFVRAVVDLNLALGTLLKNPMFEEAESEFQHLASFQTRITLRNALQVYSLSHLDNKSVVDRSVQFVQLWKLLVHCLQVTSSQDSH